ncbi:hypothetical protein GCM10029992_04100 [Glycomyces albus]
MLIAAYNRLGRPPLRRLAAACGLVAAAALVAVAYLADARTIAALALLLNLAVLGALAAVWHQARTTRAEVRRSDERAEVTYRRILAAIEVERLAAERRHSARIVPGQGGEGER